MGINCKIHYNENGTIAFVEDKNGNRSTLFDSLSQIFDQKKALDLYALTESEQFRNKENVSVKDILNYSRSTEEKLSKKEMIEAIDAIIAFKVKNSSELKTKLEEAFYDKNSVFSLNKEKLTKAGYNKYEINKIFSESFKIEKLIPKLNNSYFEVDYDDRILKFTEKINIFGKQVPLNPYITENESQQNVKTIVQGNLIDKTKGDSINVLKRTYPVNKEPLSEELKVLFNSLLNVTENVGNKEYKDVQSVVSDIKKGVVKYGVDLLDIKNRVSPIGRLKTFLRELKSYIQNPTNNFATAYDKFFELDETETTVKTEEGVIYLDTDLSEYVLFRDYNLIKTGKNKYKEVNNTTVEEIYNQFFKVQNNIKTIEEVQSRISELEVEDFNVESEVLEKMFMWKTFLKAPIKTISNEKPDFIDITDSVNNPYQKVTSNGIELINNDPITQIKSEIFEKEKIKTEKSKREKALENKSVVPKIKTDYSYIEDGVLMTKNNNEEFVRTPQGVFEKVFEEGNLNFYKEVVDENKNLTDIDFSKYFNQQIKIEDLVEAKNFYSKQELEDINNKYFNCQ